MDGQYESLCSLHVTAVLRSFAIFKTLSDKQCAFL
jgi:hypothetical protein